MDENFQNDFQMPYAYFLQFELKHSLILLVPLGSTRFDLGNALLGGKYLVFESSRSVKMRGFSFLSLHAF